jgi:hypothetical protein
LHGDVRLETSDVEATGILYFTAALVGVVVFSAIIMAGMFFYLEHRQTEANKVDLPLAAKERDRMPPAPLLTGIDPIEDAQVAWPREHDTEALPRPWFGYNVQVATPPEDVQGGSHGMDDKAPVKHVEAVIGDVNRYLKTFHPKSRKGPEPDNAWRWSPGAATSGGTGKESKP